MGARRPRPGPGPGPGPRRGSDRRARTSCSSRPAARAPRRCRATAGARHGQGAGACYRGHVTGGVGGAVGGAGGHVTGGLGGWGWGRRARTCVRTVRMLPSVVTAMRARVRALRASMACVGRGWTGVGRRVSQGATWRAAGSTAAHEGRWTDKTGPSRGGWSGRRAPLTLAAWRSSSMQFTDLAYSLSTQGRQAGRQAGGQAGGQAGTGGERGRK